MGSGRRTIWSGGSPGLGVVAAADELAFGVIVSALVAAAGRCCRPILAIGGSRGDSAARPTASCVHGARCGSEGPASPLPPAEHKQWRLLMGDGKAYRQRSIWGCALVPTPRNLLLWCAMGYRCRYLFMDGLREHASRRVLGPDIKRAG